YVFIPPDLGGVFMGRSYYPYECHADYFDFHRIEALKPAIEAWTSEEPRVRKESTRPRARPDDEIHGARHRCHLLPECGRGAAGGDRRHGVCRSPPGAAASAAAGRGGAPDVRRRLVGPGRAQRPV